MHYIDEGEGPPVVFVHGTPGWSFEFRHVARRSGYRAIVPDLIGFGLSERPAGFAYTPEAHARVLREFVDALGLTRFSLAVHDFGGPIGLPLALAGRVDRLVLMNTWMWPFDDVRDIRQARIAGGALGAWLYRHANLPLRLLMPYAYASRSRLTPEMHRHYLEPFRDGRDRERVLHTLARALLASAPYYESLWQQRHALTMPVLLLWGRRDPALGARVLARWQSILPSAETVGLDVGHWPHEEAPAAVAAALDRFLARPVHSASTR